MRRLLLLCAVVTGLPALRAAQAAAAQMPAPRPPLADSSQTDPAAAPAIEAVGLVRSAATPTRSVAILRCQGRTRVVAIGETVFGARLAAIGADTVQLEVGGRPVELRLAPTPATSALPPPPTPLATDGPPEDPATPARDMEKRQVQIRLAEEMNRILSDTALVPVLEEGRVVGLQVKRIAEGSLLTDAGLRAGDVLTRINDTTIDGMGTLIGLWPRLQSATELRAVVLRGGEPFSLRVTFR